MSSGHDEQDTSFSWGEVGWGSQQPPTTREKVGDKAECPTRAVWAPAGGTLCAWAAQEAVPTLMPAALAALRNPQHAPRVLPPPHLSNAISPNDSPNDWATPSLSRPLSTASHLRTLRPRKEPVCSEMDEYITKEERAGRCYSPGCDLSPTGGGHTQSRTEGGHLPIRQGYSAHYTRGPSINMNSLTPHHSGRWEGP